MKQLIYFLIAVMAISCVKAQDIHFSQFYNSPLTLNPALTGVMDGRFRAGVIYRDQWRSVTSPFTTISGYADIPVSKGLKNGDQVGVGIMLFNDKTGTAGLSNFTGLLSAAYHKTLGVNKTHVLSFGLQIGITSKRLDMSKAVFADQADNTLSPVNTSADAANISSKTHEELNIGIGYSARFGKRSRFYVGGSFFHLTQPKESLSQTDSRLPMRFLAHAGMDIAVGEKVSILPSVVYMFQAKDQEINLGTGVSYAFADGIKGIVGLYYRVSDAVIPAVGVDIKGFNFMFSYDVNASSLSKASKNRGAFELSLAYILPFKKSPYENSVIYSPRF